MGAGVGPSARLISKRPNGGVTCPSSESYASTENAQGTKDPATSDLNRDRLPHDHRGNDFGLQVMPWTEPNRRCEFNGCKFGRSDVRACRSVEHFALTGVVNKKLEMIGVLFNHEAQTF